MREWPARAAVVLQINVASTERQEGKRMKKCPFCAEEIKDEAVKCRFCGERLDETGQVKPKWYHTTYAVVIALACVGPIALPLVWLNPRYSIGTKVWVTVLVVALTILLYYVTVTLYVRLMEQLRELGVFD